MKNTLKEKFLSPSKQTYQESIGKIISSLCILIIITLVVSILGFVTTKGIDTFTQSKINVFDFLFGNVWSPSSTGANGKPEVGAAPMIVTSFTVTLISAAIATPFAIACAIFMTFIANSKGSRLLRSTIELLVGIPSVIYGYIGLTLVVPLVRSFYGGTGFGILAGAIVLFVMILPTVTSLTVDSIKAVPDYYIKASYGLGATRWQTIYKVVLKISLPGILTAIIFGMTRAFGEALAVQMVIGNSITMPTNLTTPASTLTSQLTTGIGNTIMGTLQNNALWSLALVLLFMSLFFNVLIKIIGKRGAAKYES
ncbi:phosphate ABC transporter permease [Apilactobacillus ozensis DSM 23829 = JCM 17196]|uniref:Phosphate transport system permease protein n=1 Tax=Apilactobacillus ozensis DSM 23829 = JCM 17196 TaxID=1423781 RepID=A0A0R2AP99_9LACO|nr:phosphate ABC transporter permease subunit PstC [Apilactobacillus ozensis]KRM68322.1 phosphate ABC transporter permease [Apilactobacillus ozensis DSM 23829 = JCM 17196]